LLCSIKPPRKKSVRNGEASTFLAEGDEPDALYNICFAGIEQAITPATSVIMLLHHYGQPAGPMNSNF
jgi:hypothetical protein